MRRAALLALLLAPAGARAQVPAMPLFEDGQKVLALQFGLARPTATNGFDRAARTGPAVGLQFLHYAADWVAVGAQLDYLKPGKRSATAEAKALTALVRLNLVRERSWTPYLLGGAGYHVFDYEHGPAAAGGACDPLTGGCGAGTASASGLAVTAAGGAEAFLFRGLSLSAEARWHELRLKRGTFAGNAEFLGFLVGLRLTFG